MNYLGMDARTGLRIVDRAHLRQSLIKVLTTQIETRVRRRPFGSVGPAIVDAPLNGVTLLQFYAAAATAITAWEPRVVVRSIAAVVSTTEPGKVQITINADEVDRPESARPLSFDITV